MLSFPRSSTLACWPSKSPGESQAGNFSHLCDSRDCGGKGRVCLSPYSHCMNWERCQYWWGTQVQGTQRHSPGSHSPLVAESKAGTIMFGELDYDSYINTMLPFNYMWKIRLIHREHQKTRSHPWLGIHCAPWAFSERGWGFIDSRVHCKIESGVFIMRPAVASGGLLTSFRLCVC